MTIQGRTLGQILKEKLEELEDEKVMVSGIPYKVELPRDAVNSPEHYKMGGVETIDFIEAKATKEELRGYLKFNVIKYLSRAKYKGNDLQDLKKAQWYLNRLVDGYGEQNEN